MRKLLIALTLLAFAITSDALDYKSLLTYTFVAVGPSITQKEAQRILAGEQAAGHIPPAMPARAAH